MKSKNLKMWIMQDIKATGWFNLLAQVAFKAVGNYKTIAVPAQSGGEKPQRGRASLQRFVLCWRCVFVFGPQRCQMAKLLSAAE